jgi:F-type H+-transporting ATPase subunit b
VAPPNYSLILIMVCFWLIFFLGKGLLINPLGGLLDERDARVRTAAEAHEVARHELSEALNRCEREIAAAASEGQKERTALRAEGEAERKRQIEVARAKGQERLARLTAEIEQAAEQARSELRRQAREMAVDLAQRLLGRRLAS